MLPCFVSVLLTFKIQGVLTFEKKIRRQKVKVGRSKNPRVIVRFSLSTITCVFLDVFAKLRKTTIGFIMSVCPFVCPSIRPHGTSWMFIKLCFIIFSKICRENSSFVQIWHKKGTLLEDLCTFMPISRWILLRMRNVSDKSCRENQNTHFIFS